MGLSGPGSYFVTAFPLAFMFSLIVEVNGAGHLVLVLNIIELLDN